MHISEQTIHLVSSCLIGLCTRYDGCVQANNSCIRQLKGSIWIPVCPEQLGGLPTPRTAADIIGGSGRDVLAGNARVITRQGEDVTAQFINGANQVLKIAQSQPVTSVFLTANSPSCGVTNPQGVTAALLLENGFSLKEF